MHFIPARNTHMGGVQSEEALDREAEKYIREQTREDLMSLQNAEYCNEVLGVVSDILRAVEWRVFSFKGRTLEPDRAYGAMARYYIQVAQMFAAGVRASLPPPLNLRPYFDTVYDPEKGYTASAASLANYKRVLAAVAAGCEKPGIDALALAGTYGERVAQRNRLVERVRGRVQFPQMGELARTMAEIKEELKRVEAQTLEINQEIKHRAEVLEARLHYDLLNQRIEILENL